MRLSPSHVLDAFRALSERRLFLSRHEAKRTALTLMVIRLIAAFWVVWPLRRWSLTRRRLWATGETGFSLTTKTRSAFLSCGASGDRGRKATTRTSLVDMARKTRDRTITLVAYTSPFWRPMMAPIASAFQMDTGPSSL